MVGASVETLFDYVAIIHCSTYDADEGIGDNVMSEWAACCERRVCCERRARPRVISAISDVSQSEPRNLQNAGIFVTRL